MKTYIIAYKNFEVLCDVIKNVIDKYDIKPYFIKSKSDKYIGYHIFSQKDFKRIVKDIADLIASLKISDVDLKFFFYENKKLTQFTLDCDDLFIKLNHKLEGKK